MKAITQTYKLFAILIASFFCVMSLALFGCGSTDPASLYEKKCSGCHTLESIEDASGRFADEAAWREQIAVMQKKTDTISDADADTIAAYLASK